LTITTGDGKPGLCVILFSFVNMSEETLWSIVGPLSFVLRKGVNANYYSRESPEPTGMEFYILLDTTKMKMGLKAKIPPCNTGNGYIG